MKGGNKKDDRKDSDEPMSWDQVVALTHKENVSLRPTLSDDMDAAILALIRSCWADDPELRPSFSVILVRLDATKRRNAMRLKEEEAEEDETELRNAIRSFHDLMWILRSSDASLSGALDLQSLLDAGTTVKAVDDVLDKIVNSEKGPDSIRSLACTLSSLF